MAITTTDKIKINKYIKEHALDEIYYLDLCNALCKKKKITDEEFLEYFTDCVVNEFHKEEAISLKYLTKLIFLIDAFLNSMHESNKEVKEETLDKIRSFKDFYMDYSNRTGIDLGLEFNTQFIDEVSKTVDELYPCEKSNESLTKYIDQVAKLESQIKSLKKQLEEVNKMYDNLKNASDQKTTKIETLNGELLSLRQNDENNREKILRLNENISVLTDKIDSLEKSLVSASEEKKALLVSSHKEKETLDSYQKRYEDLEKEIEQLKEEIEEEQRAKEKAYNLEIRQTSLEELLYQKLLVESTSIEEIIKCVEEKGFSTNRNEIISLLKRMKGRLNVDTIFFSQNPKYKIIAPTVLQNGYFSISLPNECKKYDIMLISDLHIKDLDDETVKGFDILNDYCTHNNIHLILNLGDFYEGDVNLSYESAINNYKLIEKTISLLPRADGLYHAVLGGNHDKRILKYGFDPIKILSEEREDFINLGYTHSTISLNNSQNILGRFDIHHPSGFGSLHRLPLRIDNVIEITERLENYLNTIYSKQGRNREDSYIDILGHMHKSQFNSSSSYCYIPNFFDLQKGISACHLRIYFDEATKIKYMVFMPLSLNHQLVKNSEIIYQKVLKK